ncbi:MAG TPA: ABC transporter ATP-binding protein, partial [Planctomycetaceae bacterium]|nr:ABC transporter ATP-binding protein [Planctomycetaceae bacterium]
LGVVPQNLAIYPDLTARENLDFFGRLYGLRGDRLDKRIEETLELAGLSPRADDAAGTFSGGMKRRLNFAVALMHEPSLLILDEPTVGVDPQSRAHLLNCVRKLGAAGTGVIYASHYMEEVQAICHRAAIIDHGRLLACGPMSELLQQVTPGISFRVAAIPEPVVERLRRLPNVTVAVNGRDVPGMNKAIRLAWKVPPAATSSGTSPEPLWTSSPTTESPSVRSKHRSRTWRNCFCG